MLAITTIDLPGDPLSKKKRNKGAPSRPATPPPPVHHLTPQRRVAIIGAATTLLVALAWVAMHLGPGVGTPVVTAPPSPSAVDAAIARHAADVLARCTAAGASTVPCVQADLEQVLRTNGQRAAFAVLTQVARSPALAGHDHDLAHQLGRLSYEVAGNPAKALADCPGTMGSGCTHGVVEEYLKAKGTNASLDGLCQGTGPGAANMIHQCWHGVGHGMLMAHHYDWAAAVQPCAAIAEFMDRVNCASGVFMQNLMAYSAGGATTTGMEGMAGMEGMEGMDHDMPKAPSLRPDDLLYPCDKVTNHEAAIGCWQMHPFAVLKLTKGSFERAFWACAQSGQYAVMCDEGVGQAAGAASRTDHRPPLSYCAATTDRTAWRRCMIGAVKDLIMNAHAIEPGLALCGKATDDYALDCYGAVGRMNAGLESRPEVRRSMCSRVASAPYRDACAAN